MVFEYCMATVDILHTQTGQVVYPRLQPGWTDICQVYQVAQNMSSTSCQHLLSCGFLKQTKNSEQQISIAQASHLCNYAIIRLSANMMAAIAEQESPAQWEILSSSRTNFTHANPLSELNWGTVIMHATYIEPLQIKFLNALMIIFTETTLKVFMSWITA